MKTKVSIVSNIELNKEDRLHIDSTAEILRNILCHLDDLEKLSAIDEEAKIFNVDPFEFSLNDLRDTLIIIDILAEDDTIKIDLDVTKTEEEDWE